MATKRASSGWLPPRCVGVRLTQSEVNIVASVKYGNGDNAASVGAGTPADDSAFSIMAAVATLQYIWFVCARVTARQTPKSVARRLRARACVVKCMMRLENVCTWLALRMRT